MAAVSGTRDVSELPRGAAPRARWSILSRISLLVAALIALPVLAVVSSVLETGDGSWTHLAETSLARYVGNTALLLVLVAWGVISMGVLTAWFVTAYRFPGRSVLE